MAVEMLDKVGIPDAAARVNAVPARVLGRHAAARHDRHGHLLQPRHPDRRRAHDGARRHHPGADPRPDARDAGAVRLGRHPHHPRPRRRGRDGRRRDGDVRRPHGRERAGRRDLLQRRTTRTPGACSARCRVSTRPRRQRLYADQGPAAEPAAAARRAARSPALPATSCQSVPRPAAPRARDRRARARRALLDPAAPSAKRSAPSCRVSRQRVAREHPRSHRPEEALPDQAGLLKRTTGHVYAVDGVPSRSRRARRWAWSARAAAASPRPARVILRLLGRPPAGASSTAMDVLAALARAACSACAATCRSSSRTRTRR